MASTGRNRPPFGSTRDPYRQFNASLRAMTQLTRFQESLLPLQQFEKAMQPITAVKCLQDSLAPLKQFENFASFHNTILGVSGTRSALLANQFPNLRLPHFTTFGDVQAALGIPIENMRWLIDHAAGEVALDPETLAEFEQTVDDESATGAPSLLFDRLLWLPSIAQRRVYLAAVWALKELVSYVDLEANVPPPGHVLQLVSLLWAVAFVLSELIEYESSDS